MQKLINKFKGTDLEMPDGLSDLGRKTWHKIVSTLNRDKKTYTGGCKMFQSPKVWDEKNPSMKCGELAIIYDGGDGKYYFDYSNEDCKKIEKIVEVLKPLGVYTECLYHWCSGVYKI